MPEIILPSIAILISLIILIVLLVKKDKVNDNFGIGDPFNNLPDQVQSLDRLIREEFERNREALQKALRENREELSNSFKTLGDGQNKQFETFNKNLNDLVKLFTERTERLYEVMQITAKENRTEQTKSLTEIRETVEKKLTNLQEDNSKKLEEMRKTVDEKLHKTLEERLGQSFKIVSERLEAVQKGLGEMQNLANGVGDLKKVLSNVKTRGVLGEIQLGNILEQIMAPEQYESNVKTKQGSNDHVEFAIKLPGKDDAGKEVYLPIDAKFPQEDYVRLQTAYDSGDAAAVEASNRALVQSIKKFAKDIRDKYIDPPHTTDFGIMFLPIEGLFAEVVRQPDLVALLQREYKIIVTGPTTLAAMLNSLQMGFKTLAIQKRSSEVWQILGAVKTEFGKFGEVLEKAQKKLNDANKELDSLVGTRTRILLSKLKKVEELPATESTQLIDGAIEFEEDEDQK